MKHIRIIPFLLMPLLLTGCDKIEVKKPKFSDMGNEVSFDDFFDAANSALNKVDIFAEKNVGSKIISSIHTCEEASLKSKETEKILVDSNSYVIKRDFVRKAEGSDGVGNNQNYGQQFQEISYQEQKYYGSVTYDKKSKDKYCYAFKTIDNDNTLEKRHFEELKAIVGTTVGLYNGVLYGDIGAIIIDKDAFKEEWDISDFKFYINNNVFSYIHEQENGVRTVQYEFTEVSIKFKHYYESANYRCADETEYKDKKVSLEPTDTTGLSCIFSSDLDDDNE